MYVGRHFKKWTEKRDSRGEREVGTRDEGTRRLRGWLWYEEEGGMLLAEFQQVQTAVAR